MGEQVSTKHFSEMLDIFCINSTLARCLLDNVSEEVMDFLSDLNFFFFTCVTHKQYGIYWHLHVIM